MAVQPVTGDGRGTRLGATDDRQQLIDGLPRGIVPAAGEKRFLATYRHHAGELIAAVAAAQDAATQDGGDWRDRAEAALSALLKGLAERPAVAHMLLIEVGTAGPKALAERDRAILRLGCVIGEGALERAEPTAPGLLFQNVVGSIVGLIYAWVLAGRTAQLEQLLPACTYLTLVALEGPGSAAARSGLLETSVDQR
jgi:AcrR family transcriptional regulator